MFLHLRYIYESLTKIRPSFKSRTSDKIHLHVFGYSKFLHTEDLTKASTNSFGWARQTNLVFFPVADVSFFLHVLPRILWKSFSCLFVFVVFRELVFTLIIWQAIISIQRKATADAGTNVGEFINYLIGVVASGEVGDTADVLIHDNDFENGREMMRFSTENRILTFFMASKKLWQCSVSVIIFFLG